MADTWGEGCKFAISARATGVDDRCAYGSLFQWGRKADGHELIEYVDNSTGRGHYGSTSTNADKPSSSLFIKEDEDPYDWRVVSDSTLWDVTALVRMKYVHMGIMCLVMTNGRLKFMRRT